MQRNLQPALPLSRLRLPQSGFHGRSFGGHRLQLRERTVPHCGALTALNTVGKPRSTGPTSEPIKPRRNPFSNFEHTKIRLVLAVCRSTVLNEGWKSRIPEHLLSYCSLGCRTVINFGAKTSSILFDFKILQTSNKTRFTSQSLFSCFKNILGPKQGSGEHLPTKAFDQDVPSRTSTRISQYRLST